MALTAHGAEHVPSSVDRAKNFPDIKKYMTILSTQIMLYKVPNVITSVTIDFQQINITTKSQKHTKLFQNLIVLGPFAKSTFWQLCLASAFPHTAG
jgi:hypothetical protein